jgi:hypothetical protein
MAGALESLDMAELVRITRRPNHGAQIWGSSKWRTLFRSRGEDQNKYACFART